NQFYTKKMTAIGATPNDIQSLDDLSSLPLTTKSELLQAQADAPPFGTNATFDESAYTRFHQTSGTTGVPLRVVDTPESWAWWSNCWGYVLAGAGLTANDRLFVPFSFGPFIGFWAAVGGAEKIGAVMIPGGGRNSAQRLHLMRELQVTAMCCTPTYALRLAEVARENNFDLSDIPIQITIHAGEPGANIPATKSRIEETWRAKCFDHAGASEVGAHSFECQAQPGGTHIIESEFIAEVIDPETGQTVADEEMGELVITNLGRIGYPVIRYRTGDLVKFSRQPCECGRTFGRFDGGVIGRVDDMVIIRGVNVFPSAVENLIRQFKAVDEFRVQVMKRNEMAELTIELECADGIDSEEISRTILQQFQNMMGLRPLITVVPYNSLPRFDLKAKRFHF
ncbi:MAG: phenylacetate--CoA ligase, partial [Chloroflexi bacterium]|nr:phenylacetate--CoA ligase [Chloroflexota bacterium]